MQSISCLVKILHDVEGHVAARLIAILQHLIFPPGQHQIPWSFGVLCELEDERRMSGCWMYRDVVRRFKVNQAFIPMVLARVNKFSQRLDQSTIKTFRFTVTLRMI